MQQTAPRHLGRCAATSVLLGLVLLASAGIASVASGLAATASEANDVVQLREPVAQRATAKMKLLSADPTTGTFYVTDSEFVTGAAQLSDSGRFVSMLASHSMDPKIKTTSRWRVWSGDLRAELADRFDAVDGGVRLSGETGPLLDISDDGRFTVYWNEAESVLRGYSNTALIYDRQTRAVAPAVPKGVIAPDWVIRDYFATRISGDGSKVLFEFEVRDGLGTGLGLIDRASGTLVDTVVVDNSGQAPSFSGMDLDSDGSTIVSSLREADAEFNYPARLYVWDRATDELDLIPGQPGSIGAPIQLSSDGVLVVFTNDLSTGINPSGNSAYALDITTGVLRSRAAPRGPAYVSDLSSDGQWVAVSLNDGGYLWNLSTDELLPVPGPSTAPTGWRLSSSYPAGVSADASRVTVGATYTRSGKSRSEMFLWKR